MNFDNLSAEGYAALVLGIIFSIVCFAGFIYFAKHKESSKLLTILTTMVFPALAVFFWVYLIMNVYEYQVGIALGVSVGCAFGYLIVALLIAVIAVAIINHNKKAKEEKAKLVEEKPEEPVEEEPKLLIAPVEEDTNAIEEVKEEPVEEDTNAIEEVKEEPVEEEATIENVETPAEETEVTGEAVGEQGVVFANGPKKTFEEMLAELDEERRNFYSEIIDYAMAKEETKYSVAKYHAMVKVGRMKLLEAKFAKETLTCNLMAGSSELKNYSLKEKAVKIKEKPVVIEIDSTESVAVAKNMIDIVYKNISDAKVEKLEEKKAQRKSRSKKNVEETVETPAQEVETTEVATPVEETAPKKRGRKKKSETSETEEN